MPRIRALTAAIAATAATTAANADLLVYEVAGTLELNDPVANGGFGTGTFDYSLALTLDPDAPPNVVDIVLAVITVYEAVDARLTINGVEASPDAMGTSRFLVVDDADPLNPDLFSILAYDLNITAMTAPGSTLLAGGPLLPDQDAADLFTLEPPPAYTPPSSAFSGPTRISAENLTVNSFTITPAPGSAALLAACGLLAPRRRR